MTNWLRIETGGTFHGASATVNLDAKPCPTVNTGGVGPGNRSHHYWIEEDRVVPKEHRTKRERQLFDAAPAKPEYRVPSMEEVAAIEWNGLTVVSTFAGCGGSSTGYRMAGFRVLWANEFVPAAQASYRANMAPGTVLDCRDVREVTAESILAATGLARGELDVLDGSPPCQAFSTAGKREKGWGEERTYAHGAKQKNEELFWDFVRLRDGLQPRAFVAENVSGLVKGAAKGFFLEILRRLQAGYRVEARVLDAQWLGVPQQRQRVIFVGVREDLGLAPAFPSPLPYRYSVRDALPWLGGGRVEQKSRYDAELDVTDAAALTVRSSDGSKAGQEITVVKNKNAAYYSDGERRSAHEVAPTVMSRRVNFEVEEPTIGTHTGHGYAKRSLPIDEPLTTVVAGGSKLPTIEYRGQPSGKEWQTRTRSVDQPSAAVTKDGYAGAARHQVHVVERLIQGPEVDQRNHGRPIDVEVPSPTVAAGEAKKRTPRQFQVERVIHDTGRPNVPAKDVTDSPCPTVTAGPVDPKTGGGPRNHFKVEARKIANGEVVADNVAATLEGYAVGAEWDKLNPGQQSDKFFSLVKPDLSQPCPTITSQGSGGGGTGAPGGVASVAHPTEKRKFTIAELRRICSFPDDFALTGTYAQQWERLGNSVPPVMMFWVACALRDRVLLPAAEARGRSSTATRRGRGTPRARRPRATAKESSPA